MGDHSSSDNPYSAPQSDLQRSPVAPAMEPLTREIAARFAIISVASSVTLFVAHSLLHGILTREFFTAHYGTFTWQRLIEYAAQDGFAYGVIFALSMLGSVWYFSKQQVHRSALWRYYYGMLAIMLVAWMCGGILGIAAHLYGWAAAIPDSLRFDLAKLLLNESLLLAWFIGAQSAAIACGTLGLIAVPILFTIRLRVGELPRASESL